MAFPNSMDSIVLGGWCVICRW